MFDFSNAIEEINTYGGSEKKKTLVFEGKRYLVKFPDPIRAKNKSISYINNAYSEFIGSHIFSLCGFNTQKTYLGNYLYKDKYKVICACEDFTDKDHALYEFEKLALSSNPNKKIETEISDIISVLEESNQLIKISNIKEYFWNMFIIDALIGNTDRHNGNWGFILNKISNSFEISPIYDCGSCLFPLLSDDDISKLTDGEIKNIAINTHSCLKEDNSKINYMPYIESMNNSNINDALIRVFPNIDIIKINDFINSIECISDLRKNFYTRIINIRYEILRNVYEKLKQN